ncbi:MAG: hypothetical protein GF329_14285 [Candidatus Lokiarchaeota archaeon]|nr:hypothetical protein [Candidatus Lokiarchaeota archaeon]
MSVREKLIKESASSYLIQMIYIEAYAYLRQKYGSVETLNNKLKAMGRRIGRSVFKYYKPPHKSITGNVKEIIKTIAGIQNTELKKDYLEGTKDLRGFSIVFKKCPLCVEEVETEGVHYCTPTMCIMEEYINLGLKAGYVKKDFNRVEGKVLKSVSGGDDVCEYYYKIKE